MSRGKNNRRLPADDEEQSNLELLLIPTSQVVGIQQTLLASQILIGLMYNHRTDVSRPFLAFAFIWVIFVFFSFSRDIISQTRYVRIQ